jgi:hypothetical protein
MYAPVRVTHVLLSATVVGLGTRACSCPGRLQEERALPARHTCVLLSVRDWGCAAASPTCQSWPGGKGPDGSLAGLAICLPPGRDSVWLAGENGPGFFFPEKASRVPGPSLTASQFCDVIHKVCSCARHTCSPVRNCGMRALSGEERALPSRHTCVLLSVRDWGRAAASPTCQSWPGGKGPDWIPRGPRDLPATRSRWIQSVWLAGDVGR